jgi:alpha-tubulin suppressor-like RCC1 family protein
MAWGTNDYGQLGEGTFNDSSTPVRVVGLSNVTAIACGGQAAIAVERISLALLGDGTVMAWGHNSSGQLGGTAITPGTFAVQVSGLANAKAIAAGAEFSLAVF